VISFLTSWVGLAGSAIAVALSVWALPRFVFNSWVDDRIADGNKPVLEAVSELGDRVDTKFETLGKQVADVATAQQVQDATARETVRRVGKTEDDVNSLGSKVHSLDKEVALATERSNTVLKVLGHKN